MTKQLPKDESSSPTYALSTGATEPKIEYIRADLCSNEAKQLAQMEEDLAKKDATIKLLREALEYYSKGCHFRLFDGDTMESGAIALSALSKIEGIE